MVLYLNTAQAGRLTVALVHGERVLRQRSVRFGRHAKVSLPRLMAGVFLRRQLRQLDAVAVANRRASDGPGPTFSQLRGGVVCANAVAYACGVPVLEVPAQSPATFAQSSSGRRLHARRRLFALPHYQRPPNITHSPH